MCQSQFCQSVMHEFQWKHLGFTGIHPSRFSYFQWRLPVAVNLVYRFIVAAYCIVWLIYTASYADNILVGDHYVPWPAFLTNWTYFILTLYLTLHFVACIIYICKRGGNCCSQPSVEHHFGLFHELQVEPSLWVPGDHEPSDYEFVHGSSNEEVTLGPTDFTISILLKLVWILYSIASSICLMVTLLFWITLWPYMNHTRFGFLLNFQLHAVTSIIIILEHLVSAVPIRLWHFIYTFIFGIIYVIFSIVYYAVDHVVIYPVLLDWGKPCTPIFVCLLTSLVAMPLAHLFFFGLYKLKLYIYRRLNQDQL